MPAWCWAPGIWVGSRSSGPALAESRSRGGSVATCAVFGAGPVGLTAAHSAGLRGAAQVFVVDKAADRPALAERYGATAVNFADSDPVQVITDATDGAGVDCGVEAVGYQ